MSWIKVIFYNLVVLFTIIGVIVISPPLIYGAYHMLNAEPVVQEDLRGQLPNYDGLDWASTHFREISALPTTYSDYITWRRDDYSGETINIVEGLRLTVQPQSITSSENEVWFFGGSTTWGTGANDNGTYPSIFARKTNASVMNFGESGYIARQSFALLSNQYITRPVSSVKRTIVFYDGVNDVAARCRSEINGLGTSQETHIRNILRQADKEWWSFYRTFEQLQNLLVAISKTVTDDNNLVVNEFYNCDTDLAKARFIAGSLVSTWEQAQNLAAANGDKFLAILQPIAFFGKPNVEHLILDDDRWVEMSRQYHVVYPLIIEAAEERGINFLDLIDAYDSKEALYIDAFHVSPNAYDILVPRIVTALRARGLF